MRSQLTNAENDNINGETWQVDYAYNTNGDINTKTAGSTTTYDYTGNQMTSVDGQGLNYDKNGNMTEGVAEGIEFEYNWDGKLREANWDNNSVNLKYDAFGNRIYKESTISGQTTKKKFIVDVVGKLPTILLEIQPGEDGLFGTADDSIGKTYMYANSQIIAQHDGDYTAGRYFYLHDRLGSVRQVINSSADVVNCYTYDPWGLTIGSETSETFFNPYRFAGYFFEPEVSQYHCFRRQYDPVTMRFTARDPVTGKFKEPRTLHVYLYCLNDPVNKIDPSDEWAAIGHYGGMEINTQVEPLGSIISTRMFFFGVEKGTYNVFWGNVKFKSAGISLPPGLGISAMFTVGWSEDAQRPEHLAGPYFEIGGSAAFGFAGGYSHTYSPKSKTHTDWVSVGAGLSTIPVEFHGHAGTAEVTDAWQF